MKDKLDKPESIRSIYKEEILKITKSIEELIKKDKDDPELYYMLGGVYLMQGLYKKSYKYLDIGDKLFDDMLDKGRKVLCKDDKPEEAIKIFNKLKGISSDDPDVLFSIATIHFTQDLLDEAIVEIEKAIKSNKDKEDYYFIKGHILNKKGDYKGALSALNKALEINSEEDTTYELMGDIYYNMKMVDEALRCYYKAYEIEANDHYLNLLLKCLFDIFKKRKKKL